MEEPPIRNFGGGTTTETDQFGFDGCDEAALGTRFCREDVAPLDPAL